MAVDFNDLPADVRERLIARGVAPAPRAKRARRAVTATWTYRCRGAAGSGCDFEVTSPTETLIERHCRDAGHVRYELVLPSAT
jgi:hypothetical protein